MISLHKHEIFDCRVTGGTNRNYLLGFHQDVEQSIGNLIRNKFHSHKLQLLLMVKPWKPRKKWFPDPGCGWNWKKNTWFWAFSTEPCLEGAASFHANFSHYFQVQAGNSEAGKVANGTSVKQPPRFSWQRTTKTRTISRLRLTVSASKSVCLKSV